MALSMVVPKFLSASVLPALAIMLAYCFRHMSNHMSVGIADLRARSNTATASLTGIVAKSARAGVPLARAPVPCPFAVDARDVLFFVITAVLSVRGK